MEILTYPDPRLKKTAKNITLFDQELHQLLDEMTDTMYHSGGIGLAAPQLGHDQRVFIIDLSSENSETKKVCEFINPKISSKEGRIVFEEGCLSFPSITCAIRRFKKIKVEYQDRYGNLHRLSAEGLFSVAIQHENDHLDGILFVDRLPFYKRYFAKKKALKKVTRL